MLTRVFCESFHVTVAATLVAFAEHMLKQPLSRTFRADRRKRRQRGEEEKRRRGKGKEIEKEGKEQELEGEQKTKMERLRKG